MRAAWLLIVCACKARAPDAAPGSGSGSSSSVAVDVLATDQPEPSAIATDGAYIYWTHWSRPLVRRLSFTGGAIETVYEGRGEVGGRSLALGSDALYFDEAFNIWRVAKTGTGATVLGHVKQLPMRMTGDDSGTYFEDDDVGAFPAAGGVRMFGNFHDTMDVAVDATHVYWIDDHALARVPKIGGTVEPLAFGNFAFARIAVGDADVYFGTDGLDSIFAVPKSGGKIRFVTHRWSVATGAFAVGGGALWWLESGDLVRIEPATGISTTVATGLARGGTADHMYGVAPTHDWVYVAAGGEDVEGSGPQVIDLTGNPGAAPPPKLRYGGEILRVRATPPPGATTTGPGALTFQVDADHSVTWLGWVGNTLTEAIKAGKIRVQLAGNADAARAVEAGIRAKLGANVQVTIVSGGAIVEVTLDPDDVGTAMTARSARE